MNKLIIIAIISVLLMSCGPNEKEKIFIGKWEMTQIRPSESEESSSMEAYVQMELINKMIQSRTYNFKQDHSFINMVNKQKEISGNWEIDFKTQKLVLTIDNKTEEYVVDSLSQNRMVWYFLNSPLEMVLQKTNN